MLRKVSVLAAVLMLAAAPAFASGGAEHPKEIEFSFAGPFGKYDQAQLQRGYKVYREVCSACHAMDLLSFRNLGQKGGPFYDPKYPNPNDNPVVKTIAAEPSYIYSILTGFVTPPAGLNVPAGRYYNPYMPGDVSSAWTGDPHHVPPGGFIAMPPPLADGKVSFDDGSPDTANEQAKDVSAFLMWAAEPKMEDRKQMGFAVLIYLVLFAGLLYASYRRVWRNESH
jgi:ubiquinol-cytochrome c reductase cytochrome c1 subunit